MKISFYPRLAITNIRKNSKIYVPYLLTCTSTIVMFYIMYALTSNKDLLQLPGGGALTSMLLLGTFVIGLFSIILIFYTNSFLIKRRKKELGLYNILGMGKKHIAHMLLWETFFTFIITFTLGILVGVILNKLVFLLLLKITSLQIPFTAYFSIDTIILSATLFAPIFAAALAFNLLQIHLANPLQLLNDDKAGEKEPKTKILMSILGFAALIGGYYISIMTKQPIAALFNFFIAVILVIIGTYLLFTSGSIAVLKLLRKNKKFYYKTTNFTSVSGLIYRMKQNAVGLASICILSTMVLVTLSTTVSMYVGMNDILEKRFPKDFSLIIRNADDSTFAEAEKIIDDAESKYNVAYINKLSYKQQSFYNENSTTGANESYILIPLADYNRNTGRNITLNDDEVLIYEAYGEYDSNTAKLGKSTFKIKERLPNIFLDAEYTYSTNDFNGKFYFIINSEKTIIEIYDELYPQDEIRHISNIMEFDLEGSRDEKIAFSTEVRKDVIAIGETYVETKYTSLNDFMMLYGGFLFIGIFLGLLFLGATVLIIYYKQISEGYEDKNRFDIMVKVGMSQKEVKNSIGKQILLVFFLPLVMAGIHILFAFPIIVRLLSTLNLENIPLFSACCAMTLLVFAIIYALVYSFTAKTYYKIIS